MKKIKIFLASSITELKFDRLEIGDFIRQLNDVYVDRDVYFSLVKCEDYDNAISQEGKQAEYDKEIADSELVFFLFFKKVGDYTRHEFEVALEAYKNHQKPKIITYFKYVDSIDDATDEVKSFMDMLDSEIKHYYNIYQCIDTLKLGLILQIKMLNLDADETKIQDGRVLFGNVEVCQTQNIPLFANNESLDRLKQDIDRIDSRYRDLQQKYLQDKSNEAIFKKYCELASKKAELDEQLRLAENAVLKVASDMVQKTSQGNLSPRQVSAYRALERGDYDGALTILDFDQIMDDIRHNESLADVVKDRLQVNVNELMQRIEILMSDTIDASKMDELNTLFATAIDLCEKYNLSKQPLYVYSMFLSMQNKTLQAIEAAERYYSYFQLDRDSHSDDSQIEVELLLAEAYTAAELWDKAQDFSLRALQRSLQMVKDDPSNNWYVARSYSCNLTLLFTRQQYDEVQHKCIEALNQLDQYARQSSRFFHNCFDYWNVYMLMGTACMFNNKIENAKRYLTIAINSMSRMSKNNKIIERGVALGLSNLSMACKLSGDIDNAKKYALMGLKMQENLAAINPEIYERDLVAVYRNLANIYISIDPNEATLYMQKYLELEERYQDAEPGAIKIGLKSQAFHLVKESDNQLDLADILFDGNNTDIITLATDDGLSITFEQIAYIPYKDKSYFLLATTQPLLTDEAGATYVFTLDCTGDESIAYMVLDEAVIEEVYAIYLELLEEDEEDFDDEEFDDDEYELPGEISDDEYADYDDDDDPYGE